MVIDVNAYDCLVFQDGDFIEEGIFFQKTVLQAFAMSRDTEGWFFSVWHISYLKFLQTLKGVLVVYWFWMCRIFT